MPNRMGRRPYTSESGPVISCKTEKVPWYTLSVRRTSAGVVRKLSCSEGRDGMYLRRGGMGSARVGTQREAACVSGRTHISIVRGGIPPSMAITAKAPHESPSDLLAADCAWHILPPSESPRGVRA